MVLSSKLPVRTIEAESRLGEGATSTVFRARLEDGSRAALKVGLDARQAARLADEAERLLFVGSDALSRVLGAGTLPPSPSGLLAGLGGRPYLVLELAPGRAIDVRAARPAAERHALALVVARDVGRALSDLHAAGAAHGDVKPSNVVVESGASSRARLVDLGLSIDADDALPRGGTRRYLAPEVTGSGETSDGRARDLWALGLTLAEIASGDVAASSKPGALLAELELPSELGRLVTALTSAAPGSRPTAAWVSRRASDLLGARQTEDERRTRAERAIERAYLAVRRREILGAAAHAEAKVAIGGAPLEWLTRALDLARQIARLRGSPSGGDPVVLEELGAHDRARWLVALIGAHAASWPLPSLADAGLAERLLGLARDRDPAAFHRAALEDPRAAALAVPDDPIEIAWTLGSGLASGPLLDGAERLVLGGGAPERLRLVLARALRLRGEMGRALALLEQAPSAEARVEAAETARRAGDPGRAERLLAGLELGPDACEARARRAATLSRIEIDRRELERAATLLEAAPVAPAVMETRALLCMARGDRAGAEAAVERGLGLGPDDEARARLLATSGYIAHAAGQAEVALGSFRRAAEHAVRAGAVLEEATYLTGLAAAATNVGELAEALDASSRALLLFEHMGRTREAAVAALSRAASYARAGAREETREAASDAIARAKLAGNRRCRAYAHLALAAVLAAGDREGVEHARRAAALLAAGEPDDQLFAGAALLAHGDEVDVAHLDQLALGRDRAADARLEWWGARAEREARRDRPERADAVLGQLGALASASADLGVRGPALSAGARLAARVGESEVARRLALATREAARTLVRRAPPELRAAISALPWVTSVQAPAEIGVSAEQVGEVEALVHALGQRDRLRPLLDQVLDALILWTGVERGLLLLRAPGDKLLPRAARNIARSDLVGEQLALSTSLAERALRSREPVVAVDAAGELPDLYASVHALELRSVLAVPLLARGEVLGVVYLDDRVRRGAFGPAELSWVRLVAALASVAIADARDQLLLRRALRRARRAEARLSAELAQRQAELDVAERELSRSRGARGTRFPYDAILGESEPLQALLRLVDRIAVSEVPVLIIGESGSGKELVARAIHDNGPRKSRTFVGENCAAIPETLLESTLFGHVRGAFTGAARPRAGLFEVADGGTLFLDEIGEMSLGMQSKLLRVLEDGEVHPVGSERGRRVDVRVIGATHRDLPALVREGRFRQDLLYRLDVISVRVPPLRERRSDIALLVRHFVEKHAQGRPVRVGRTSLDVLTAFDWPGNVRQLENEVRRALVLADDEIALEHLSAEVRARASGAPSLASELDLRGRVDLLERELLRSALDRTAGNQTRAAELLGLSRFGLQKMMKRLAVDAVSKPGRRAASAVGRPR